MTKVATIDTRRFFALLLIAAMLIAMIPIGVAMLPSGVLAADNGTVTCNFTTSDGEPVVNSVTLDSSPMTPGTSCDITVNISDPSMVEDIDNITVYLVYDANGTIDVPFTPPSADNNTCAILTWDKDAGIPFSLDSAHSGSTWGLTGTAADNMSASVGEWVFHVTVSKVAKQSTDGAAEWHMHAYAFDGTTEDYEGGGDGSEMAWYGEIAGVASTVEWAVAQGVGTDNAQSPQFSATYYSNGLFNQKVAASGTWTAGAATLTLDEGGAPGNAEFSLIADVDSDISGSTQVTTSYATMHTGAMTLESGDPEINLYLWLSLGDTGIPQGEYSGFVFLQISNS